MTTHAQASKARISKDGLTATVSIAVSFLQRGGRKQILSPAGTAPWSPAARVERPGQGRGSRPPLAANARKRRVRILRRTGQSGKGQRFLSEPDPAADLDRARYHRGDPERTPTQHASAR